MNAAIAIVAVIAAGLFDRIRGGWPEGRPKWIAHVATAAAGAIMVAIIAPQWPLVLAGAALVGELSWRQDNGWRGAWLRREGLWWQPLRWGALWAAPLLLLAWWAPVLLIYAVTAPAGAWLAIILARRLPAADVLDLRHAWPWSELLELPIIGALTITAACVLRAVSILP